MKVNGLLSTYEVYSFSSEHPQTELQKAIVDLVSNYHQKGGRGDLVKAHYILSYLIKQENEQYENTNTKKSNDW
jgi:hypothetical protein